MNSTRVENGSSRPSARPSNCDGVNEHLVIGFPPQLSCKSGLESGAISAMLVQNAYRSLGAPDRESFHNVASGRNAAYK